MIKISDIVRNILDTSEIATTALSQGLLNYSAYASQIHKEVEKQTMKPVKKGTIVVALSRLANKIKKENIIPKIKVSDLSVKAPLIEIVVPKTKENMEKVREIYKRELFSSDFTTITQGIREFTIITNEESRDTMMKIFSSTDITAEIHNLIGLTVHFNKEYIQQPNIIYAIIRTLALKKINIIEIVSTYTELTFILEKKDMQTALLRLNEAYQ